MVSALVTFVDPAAGALRVATGSGSMMRRFACGTRRLAVRCS